MNSTSIRSLAPSAVSGRTVGRLALVIALGALAPQLQAAKPPTHVDFRHVEHSVTAIGMTVKDSHGETVGRVDDLALDLENESVVEVVVSSGGFLGFGVRTVGVPPGALTFDSEDEALVLNMDKVKFQAAPALSMSKWAEHSQSWHVADEYRYYGQNPYFNDETPLGYIQCSRQLVTIPVKNLKDETLGSVAAFFFDMPMRSILHVVVVGPGRLQTKSIVPASALRFNATHDTLYLDVSTKAFKNEPRFKWTSGHAGDFQEETYANTKVAANDGVNTRQNVTEKTAATYTPLAQGTSFDDVDMTHRIYTAMRLDGQLSQNAQNVEVGTLNGRVTLRGHVNTDAGKQAIGQIADSAARPENVSNLLEVRPVSVTK